jgi:NAD(P)-dependent dehydrogenase (short-subunit alcohol dehydrogenase family)
MNTSVQIALVTGCSRSEGLGFEVCKQFGELGFTVLLTARNASKAETLAAMLRDQGLDVDGHALDIAHDESIQTLVSIIAERYGRLDILINNATGSTKSPDPVSTADLEAARQIVDVTLIGNWRLIQGTLPLLRKSAAARIVNVSSSAGLQGDPVLGLTKKWTGRPAYGIAKAALNALTAKFAVELRGTDIKINAVCPGFTATHSGMADLGARSVAEGAKGIVWAATLDDDGPSGGFYRDNKLQAW